MFFTDTVLVGSHLPIEHMAGGAQHFARWEAAWNGQPTYLPTYPPFRKYGVIKGI